MAVLATAIAALVLAIMGQGLVTRMSRLRPLVAFILSGITSSMIALSALGVVGVHGATYVGFALVYALFCELYIFLFTLSMNSISARTLILLLSGPVEIRTLKQTYTPEMMVAARLAQMETAQLIVHNQGNYRLTDKAARLLAVTDRVRRWIGFQDA